MGEQVPRPEPPTPVNGGGEATAGRAPAVTVGIPFYNAGGTLADAIRSVIAQSFGDWELVLMDDGSTDDSLDLARSVCDPRVRVVSDGRHLGLSARLNQIAGLARAELVARMDADDMMRFDRLAAQVDYLKRNPAVDVVGTGMYILDAGGQPVAKRLPSSVPLSVRRALVGAWLMHATVMGRRDWFRRNPYDLFYERAEDFELWLRTYDRSRFAVLPDCYYYCTEHASFSLSKYATSSWFVGLAQWRHGARQVGFLVCCALTVRQVAKLIAYAVAVGLGLQGRLIARRSAGLSPAEADLVAADTARIKSIPLLHRLAGDNASQPGGK
jgi:glycosyltransferase involved in cell wall biosynthesis